MFPGWHAELAEFFEGLRLHNDKTWFERHRDMFTRAVMAPTEALAAELAPRYGEPHIFRLRRDARFAAGQPPYRTALGVQFDATAVHYYLSVSATELVTSFGRTRPDDEWVRQFRAAVAGPAGKSLQDVLAGLAEGGFDIDGSSLKTTPRGFTADHPRADLLRYRAITATRRWPPRHWLGTPAALDLIARTFDEAAGLARWLRTQIRIGDR
ncbi:DUF2461 domain-containing protein [Actinoplanes sp. NPDC051346]|uniref:DUF2461 domain-containing protein n=1 Tax=Actinoplanes sp. NPDC051346 TaxID=3155048 RepID=UPI0034427B0C